MSPLWNGTGMPAKRFVLTRRVVLSRSPTGRFFKRMFGSLTISFIRGETGLARRRASVPAVFPWPENTGGIGDDRNMFPQAARAVREIKPRAFMLENVKG